MFWDNVPVLSLAISVQAPSPSIAASFRIMTFFLDTAKDGGVDFFGDEVDIALAQFAENADEAYLTNSKFYRKIDEIPYEPVNRFSVVMMELDGKMTRDQLMLASILRPG